MDPAKSTFANYSEDPNIDRLNEYKDQFWFEIGKSDGIALFTDSAYYRSLDTIEATYNKLCKAIVESQERKIFEMEVDLYHIGNLNKNAEHIAQKAIGRFTELAEQYTKERKLHHRADTVSDCYYIIVHYRNGFEIGQEIALLAKGSPRSTIKNHLLLEPSKS